MPKKLTTIGFDADDTLWHNERFFRLTQERLANLLSEFVEVENLNDRLLEAEKRNVGHYGFGVKGFVLSMIETAIEITEERVPASVISELMEAGREMLRHPIELLPYARKTIEALADHYRLILITKGDLLDQERKLAQSGLGDLFDWVEIVSNKTPNTYADVFARHGDGASNAMMVGDSMRSDVVPAIQAGAWGVFIPNGSAWELERATAPTDSQKFVELESLKNLPNLVLKIG